MKVAVEGERDPIAMEDYEGWCRGEWHAVGIRVVGFPPGVAGGLQLCLMLVKGEKEGEVKVDNLFAVEDWEEVVREQGLHRWSETCSSRTGSATRGVQREEKGEEGAGAAEYINDADDFWAGYSDEEEEEQIKEADTHPAPQPSGVKGEGGAQSEQDRAIQDIVKGAYTLYRTSNPNSTQDGAKEAFMALVRSSVFSS